MMDGAVQAGFGLMPAHFGSSFSYAVESGLLSDDVLVADDASRDPANALLALRFVIEPKFAEQVRASQGLQVPTAAAASSQSSAATSGWSAVFRPPAQRTVAETRGQSALEGAREDVRTFRSSRALADLFEELGNADVDSHYMRTFVARWAEVAEKCAPWLGRAVRAVAVAPLRSTKAESDFSFLAHVVAPRRQRLNPLSIAAYMFARKCGKYVTEAGAGPTHTNAALSVADNKTLHAFFLGKRRTSGAVARAEEDEISASSTAPIASTDSRARASLQEIVAAVAPRVVVSRSRSGRVTTRVLDDSEDYEGSVDDDEYITGVRRQRASIASSSRTSAAATAPGTAAV